MGVVGKYGDSAMVFINKHWKALAVGTACLAFVNDPEPFINGTKELVVGGADVLVRNVAKRWPKESRAARTGPSSSASWPWGFLAVISFKIYLKQRAAKTA